MTRKGRYFGGLSLVIIVLAVLSASAVHAKYMDCEECTWLTPCTAKCIPPGGGLITCGAWGVCKDLNLPIESEVGAGDGGDHNTAMGIPGDAGIPDSFRGEVNDDPCGNGANETPMGSDDRRESSDQEAYPCACTPICPCGTPGSGCFGRCDLLTNCQCKFCVCP